MAVEVSPALVGGREPWLVGGLTCMRFSSLGRGGSGGLSSPALEDGDLSLEAIGDGCAMMSVEEFPISPARQGRGPSKVEDRLNLHYRDSSV